MTVPVVVWSMRVLLKARLGVSTLAVALWCLVLSALFAIVQKFVCKVLLVETIWVLGVDLEQMCLLGMVVAMVLRMVLSRSTSS